MTDFSAAIATAREELDDHYTQGGSLDPQPFRLLLAALDAARGEAVATVQTITSLVGETRKCIIGPAEVIDSLPVGTAVYAAPPAALAVVPEGYALVPVEPTKAMLSAARDWSLKKYGQAVGNDGARGCYAAMLAAARKVEP